MRRLVVEAYGKELEKMLENSSFQRIESLELVHSLRSDRNGNAAIWRVRLKDPGLRVENCFKGDGVTKEVQVLEREEKHVREERPFSLVFLRRTYRPGLLLPSGTTPGGGFLYGPMSLKDGRVRFTFVGTQRQAKMVLEHWLEERGIQYNVVSLTDADFAEDSLLNRLTDKQRKVLRAAYKLGYFDVPKKINSDELGDRLQLTGSTVVEHLSKAQHRLLAGILEGA